MQTYVFKRLFAALMLLNVCAHAAISVDNGQSFQTIRGFGASSAWASSYTTAQLDALFRVDTGIGLTLLRHRIPPDNNFGSGVSILQGARDRGASIWATAWTPPAQWKNTNNANSTGTNNCDPNNLAYLLPQNYQNYANYLASYVKTLRDTYNVNLFALSPQNEPNWCPNYEGSWMNGTDFQTFVRDNLGPTFQSQGLNTRIIIPEPINTGSLGSLANPCLNDANCRGYLFGIATHLYGTAASAFPAAAANGKEYWETEISSFEAYDPSMTHGLTTAGWIHGSMASGMNAFHYWWAVSDNNNEGLISQTKGNPKRYYVMGNYSKFVRPGSIRIGASGASGSIAVTAYRNPAANQLIIVVVNSGSSASSQTFNLAGLSVASVTPWITDDSRNLASQSAVAVAANAFSYSLPARSVTTFVGAIGGAVATATPTTVPTASATWRVNAGGPAYTDGAGNAWQADGNFTGGQVSTVTSAIAGTNDDTLYQSERYGNSTYTFPVPAGSYQVTLKLAEIYSGITGPGQRVFNVSINGATVLSNLDLFAEVGANTADDKVFNNVAPVNGQISIAIGPSSVENAKISAIQIIPQPAQPTATRTVTATQTATRSATATATRSATALPPTATRTGTATVTATATATATPSASPANTAASTATATPSATRTVSPQATASPAPASVVRVNAGGAAYTDSLGNVWAADSGFSGGTVHAVTDAIAGTTDDPLYQDERYGNSTYTFSVNPGSYQVTLKLADIYNGITAAGQRVFNVSLNGSQVLTNLDLFAEVGGFTADDKVFNNVSPVNGQITIQLGPASANNATIAAIQIIPQPAATATRTVSPSATPTATPSPVPGSVVRVNAGGAAYTDSLGNVWAADSGFSGGTVHAVTDAIAGTTDDPLYQDERYGNSTYTFSVNPGSYQVTLKLADIYNGITAPGQRVFNVSLNGSQVLTNLDLFAEVGGFAADDKVFNNVSPVNGQITIQLGPASANNATIAAIQIIPQPAAAPLSASRLEGGKVPAPAPAAASLILAPNPAREQVTVFYSLAQPGKVRLSLAGLDGRGVLALDLGTQAAGRHDAGLDLRGLASGVYLALLQVDEGQGAAVKASFKLAVAK